MRELTPHYNRSSVFDPGLDRIAMPEEMADEYEVRLRDRWWIIRERLWLILATFLGTVLIVGLVLHTMTPIYTATATLLIERQTPQMLNIHELLGPESAGPDEYDYYQTQFEILKGRGLASEVILDQDLNKYSPFKARHKKRSLDKVRSHSANPTSVDPKVVDGYLGSLAIEPIPRTRLVKVSFSTSDPELSARVANAHAKAYIAQGIELHLQATKEAQRYLDRKLVELRERIEKSETALNSYRRDKGILSLNDRENAIVQRLDDLNNRVTEAEAERIGLESQARLLPNRDYDSLPAVINNTLIQTLKAQLTHEQEDFASLSSQFTPRYSRVAQLQAQIDETQLRLRQEVRRVVEGIESAYLAADAKEKELRAKVDEQKSMAFGLKDASVKYAILAREVDTNRQLYDSVLQRIKEIGVATEAPMSNISIIDTATPPTRPSKPKKLLTLALSALVGLMGGLGLAFVLEYLDNTLRGPQEVERYLRLPNLGTVPEFTVMNARNHPEPVMSDTLPVEISSSYLREPAMLQHRQRALVREAYRTLHTNILLSRAGEPPKTILFTSSAQGEGKTITALNVAVTFAQMGARVLVIDADLRHSSCSKVLGATNSVGLTEVLTGQKELYEVVQNPTSHSLFLLSSGSRPPNPVALLGSRRMQDILALTRKEYDYILIDSPPVIPVTDAVLLSTLVDGVVLVVNSQHTPNYIVKEARSRLTYARAKVLGVVLNQVNMRGGDYAYHYRNYRSYHDTEDEAV